MIINYTRWAVVHEWTDLPEFFDMPLDLTVQWIIDNFNLEKALKRTGITPMNLFTELGIRIMHAHGIFLDDVIESFVASDKDNVYRVHNYASEDSEPDYEIGIISREDLVIQIGDLNDIYMHFAGKSNEV